MTNFKNLNTKIEQALHNYMHGNGTEKLLAGYDVLRYASNGWILPVDNHQYSDDVMSWYPKHHGFVVLQHVAKGNFKVNTAALEYIFNKR